MSELARIIVDAIMGMLTKYGVVIGLLALLGIFSIVSAIGQKTISAFRYLFMIFIAAPAVLIVGLINKSNRMERKKELGEIKAHLKQHPEKWKRILYYALFCILVITIVLIVWWFVKNFILPLSALNEFSKQVLQNASNYTNST